MPWVIFDLDGTLANNNHRESILRRYIDRGDNESGPSHEDWDAFHENCVSDDPYPFIIMINQLLASASINTAIITGRTERWRSATEEWLDIYGIQYHELHMRPDDNRRPDIEFKGAILDTTFRGRIIMAAFEDRDRVVAMYRERDIQCLQVKKGTY